MLHLLNCLPPQLQTWMTDHGQPGYRAGQVWRWLTEQRAAEFDAMTDLPLGLPQVIRSGTPELVADIDEALLARVSQAPDHLRQLLEAGYRSCGFGVRPGQRLADFASGVPVSLKCSLKRPSRKRL